MNGKISYEIFDGDVQGQFGIGRTNGTLFTQRSLDRESIANYTLTVLAIDQAEPPEVRRTTTTEVLQMIFSYQGMSEGLWPVDLLFSL